MNKPELPWADRPVWMSIDIGPGWWPLVTRLDADLRAIYPEYQVAQVKEKFGELRYYIEGVPQDLYSQVYERIRDAERESSRTCEECGEPGEQESVYGWMATLCPIHSDERRAAREARRDFARITEEEPEDDIFP